MPRIRIRHVSNELIHLRVGSGFCGDDSCPTRKGLKYNMIVIVNYIFLYEL